MTDLIVTRTRLADGVWEGRVQRPDGAPDAPPPIRVSLDGQDIAVGVALEPIAEELGVWSLSIRIPPEALGEGLHSFVISDAETGGRLADFSVAMGLPLESDIRAEMELLRAELDMLKRAFRRHCVETGADHGGDS